MTTTTDRLLALALACAFLDKDPSPHTRAQEILDWAEVQQRLAMGGQQSAPVTPQHSATIEDARRRAHQAAENQYERGYPVSYCINAALDAFIAAMPQQSPIDATLAQIKADALRFDGAMSGCVGERGDFGQLSVLVSIALDAAYKAGLRIGNVPHDETTALLQKTIAMQSQEIARLRAIPSRDPQPEEVPEEVHAEAHGAAVYSGGAPENVVRAVTRRVWNAARRYGPMPPKVTDEMVTNACAAVPGLLRGSVRFALEAAFAGASPKDTDQ